MTILPKNWRDLLARRPKINITINTDRDPKASGERVVAAIREYEARNGKGWRR